MFGFHPIVLTGTHLSVPIQRSEACRAKGNLMRNLVQPPPSLHCNHCDGELRLKRVEPACSPFDSDHEIFLCAKCGHEQAFSVSHDRYAAHTASNMPPAKVE